MYAQGNKTKENRSRVRATPVSQEKCPGNVNLRFDDNRPQAIKQRKLQGGIKRDPQSGISVQFSPEIDGIKGRKEVFSKVTGAETETAIQKQAVRGNVRGVVQLAGTKPNQPSVDGKYRIKLSSTREKYSYDERVKLGLDEILPGHHPLVSYFHSDGKVTKVRFAEDNSVVPLKEPIPVPSGGKQLLCIDTVGYTEPKEEMEGEEAKKVNDKKLFIDVKIGTYTKSGQQFSLEGANWFMRQIKKVEHNLKDKNRASRGVGYDIDAGNHAAFREAASDGMKKASIANAMAVASPKLLSIQRVMAENPITFVGASLFIVLNLTNADASDVKLIDPDHPIIIDKPEGGMEIPGNVMTEEKMTGGRDWDEYVDKWKTGFGTGMDNFNKMFFKTIKILRK